PDTAPAPGARPQRELEPARLYPDDQKEITAAVKLNSTIWVTIGGGIGGMIGALINSLILYAVVAILAYHTDANTKAAETIGILLVLVHLVLGGVVGAIGGCLGWLVVLSQSAKDVLDATTIPQWTRRAFLGALGGSLTFSAILGNVGTCGVFGLI